MRLGASTVSRTPSGICSTLWPSDPRACNGAKTSSVDVGGGSLGVTVDVDRPVVRTPGVGGTSRGIGTTFGMPDVFGVGAGAGPLDSLIDSCREPGKLARAA